MNKKTFLRVLVCLLFAFVLLGCSCKCSLNATKIQIISSPQMQKDTAVQGNAGNFIGGQSSPAAATAGTKNLR